MRCFKGLWSAFNLVFSFVDNVLGFICGVANKISLIFSNIKYEKMKINIHAKILTKKTSHES